MATSGSPTVRRRRLAAELKRLRGNRTGGEVARAVGWSATKISRAESGRESIPPAEIERLIDYYEVAEPLRGLLLGLAEDAAQRGWWEDYADVNPPELLEFMGLEAEVESTLQWQPDLVPGLLQTEDYMRQLGDAFQSVIPSPPSMIDRFAEARLRRQERLIREPVLHLSVILDEAVLLRRVGVNQVMRAQLRHLAHISDLPNVDLRVLPLDREIALHAGSFVIMSFGAAGGAARLGDVVSTESLSATLYVEGEIDTYRYRLFFHALTQVALPPDRSRDLIVTTGERVWA